MHTAKSYATICFSYKGCARARTTADSYGARVDE